ncbi:NAD-dependent epimerase/dehydratase family protein [Saccharopolyspora phatthalungensis]|uniref:Nucleoside-diphosphate-sugar epimerase n=1 Tax=Saccharopolyspora phatthalungensis TaxID=664693 RepID=A0A840QCG3_9PSEU|nr:NAD-dependent epimerase/dehydratase family protein [Saccharopolyspora phatthalungensis]MBB5158424.1 nucleoside-diphosphate-sugar epimerase [Saccharopolyspora phatthalungensis]
MNAGGKSRRVVVVGATGNIGTSVVEALTADPEVATVVALSRREAAVTGPKTRWERIDILRDELVDHFASADAVIHLAWLFQPTHDPVTTWRNNVVGSLRVFEAAAVAGVRTLVHASSVAAYSPGPMQGPIDEHWPTHGWPAAAYSREKAYLERCLDIFEYQHPDLRVVRMRPAFSFKAEAATQQRRLFLGPLLVNRLVRPDLLPALPTLPGMRFQAVHSDDVGEAYRLATRASRSGAFNIAADPVIDTDVLAELFGKRTLTVPAAPVRAALSAAWQLHLVPASPGLFDTFLRLPTMDTSRARTELGWAPRHTAEDAVEAFLRGLREDSGVTARHLAAVGHDS